MTNRLGICRANAIGFGNKEAASCLLSSALTGRVDSEDAIQSGQGVCGTDREGESASWTFGFTHIDTH